MKESRDQSLQYKVNKRGGKHALAYIGYRDH